MPALQELVAITDPGAVGDHLLRLADPKEPIWYRTPSLKVAGNGFARLCTEAEGGLVLMCDLGKTEALLASTDPAYVRHDLAL